MLKVQRLRQSEVWRAFHSVHEAASTSLGPLCLDGSSCNSVTHADMMDRISEKAVVGR